MPALRDLTLADALIVCADMRPEDAACVRAVAGREPGEWFAVDRWQASGPGWSAWQDGAPVAIGGMTYPAPWIGRLWLVARPSIHGSTWREVLRAVRALMESLDPAHPYPVRRIEAQVLHGWKTAGALVSHLGLTLEGVRRCAGSGGESIEDWAAVARED